MTYAIHPAGPYGPTWKNRRPPGLPASARPASRYHAAMPEVRRYAAAQGLGEDFVTGMSELADGESGAIYGMPAHNFDGRLIEGYSVERAKRLRLVADPNGARRPRDLPLILAWGVFSMNRDAWRSVRGVDRLAFPWECTPDDEVRLSVEHYGRIWRRTVAAGLNSAQAQALVRVWHAGPAWYRRVIEGVEASGAGAFEALWARHVPRTNRRRIAKHVTESGIGGLVA